MTRTTSATTSGTIRVSVVVPTCGRMDLLDRCLDALTRQTLAPGAYEVIVVDDEPNHNTLHLVAGWRARTLERGPRLVYLANAGTHGLAAARNLGWRAAQAPVVAFTGDDAVPSGAWLAEALDLFSDDVDVLCGGVDAPQSAARHGAAPAQPSVTPPTLCLANCFCRKSVLEALDGFDERFSEACHDDADLHFRLLDVHARIVHAPQARVVQPVLPPRWGESLGQARRAVFDALLYKKHPHLYRAHIGAAPPWDDYLATAALLVTLGAFLFRHDAIAILAGLAWLGLTARLCRRRLHGHTRGATHVAEIVVTSALLPPLAVFWRLAGAIRYRVRFT
ncbi:glycosyltransferase [Massilia sp. Dwa41.01b]|uniref:glycosyltransferase n=1 Tax=Massilia sp. Dwa41.01b TaxID=2709302 RepID=UPI001603968F|nr:glycosyltransferase [Massilia sp. Dwa41.01b]QNA89859.1 glycosyltransferase [Massilia sp. Dwa41.01b]